MSSPKEKIQAKIQAIVDSFGQKNADCCAGCSYWRWHNSVVGDCHRTAPVSGADRFTLLGMHIVGKRVPSGHIVTPRDHWCGEFDSRFKVEPPSSD